MKIEYVECRWRGTVNNKNTNKRGLFFPLWYYFFFLLFKILRIENKGLFINKSIDQKQNKTKKIVDKYI